LIEEREVRECLLAGRCVPKLEKPIIERIMESESESDIFGGRLWGIYCNVKNIGRAVKLIADVRQKNLLMEIEFLLLSTSVETVSLRGAGRHRSGLSGCEEWWEERMGKSRFHRLGG
jgi:hypothetical protein